jgi:hypothetical protein
VINRWNDTIAAHDGASPPNDGIFAELASETLNPGTLDGGLLIERRLFDLHDTMSHANKPAVDVKRLRGYEHRIFACEK